MDDTMEELPVRDQKDWMDGKSPGVQERKVIEKWNREDIEDNYLKLYSENILLKQHGRKQEEKIKKMATKLLKLTNDNKKLKEGQISGRTPSAGPSKRDFELKEKLEDAEMKMFELQKENNMLKDRLAVAKHQLSVQSKRPGNPAYSFINHRIDTGRGVKGDGARPITPRAHARPQEARPQLNTQPRYGHSLLEEAREENAKLHDALVMMEQQLQEAERESDHLKDQLRQQESEKHEHLTKYQQAITIDKEAKKQENVEIIKLQGEIKEKSTRFTSLQLQYQTLEESLNSVKSTNRQLLSELERLNRELQEEQNRCIDLRSKMGDEMSKEKTLLETKHRLQLLEQENKLLKSNNESLMKTAMDTERDTASLQKEKELRLEIAKLQAALKGDLSDKGDILDKYHAESEAHEKLKTEMRSLQVEYYTIRQQHETAQEKLKFFTSQSGVDYTELEEALALIQSRKSGSSQKDRPDFVESTDDVPSLKRLQDLESQMAETMAELEKSRNMLIQQYNINKVYKKEVDTSTQRLEEYKKEFESRAEEYARLLDIRQARIKKLEAQLRDVAYGTKSMRVPSAEMAENLEEDEDTLAYDTLDLERGKNIFEINVDRVNVSAEALAMIGDSQPSLFVTYGFHDFETQTTPVCKAPVAVFKFTSQYKVDMDDTFLHHLMKNSTEFELHQAIGTDFRTLASARISFAEIFENPKGRLYASATLIGKSRDGIEVVGTIEYSIRFIVPVDQALRLYRERVKALGYSQVNAQVDAAALRVLEGEETIEPGMNHLYIKVERCTDLNAILPDRQPSPYVVYKFYDFDDYDTAIIANSCNPEFSDNKSFKVEMNDSLDNHLKSNELDFFVFDDSQEKGELSFLGVARVPLVELTYNKPIRGPYQINLPDGKPNGTIVVSLRWFTDYKTEEMIRGAARQLIAEREKEEDELNTLRSMKTSGVHVEEQPHLMEIRPETSGRNVASHVEAESISPPSKVSADLNEERPVKQEKPASPVRKVSPPQPSQEPQESNFGKKHPPKKEKSKVSSVKYEDDFDSDDELFADRNTKSVESAPEKVDDAPKSILKSSHPKQERAEEMGEVQDPGEIVPPTEQPVKDNKTYAAAVTGVQSEAEETVDQVIEASDVESTDSEAVVSSKTLRSSVTFEEDPDTIMVAVHSVTLEDQCRALKNPKLVALFVSYKFLDTPIDLTETPNSVAKSKVAGESVVFNFHKAFSVDEEGHSSSRDALKEMFVATKSADRKIRFDVVAEPKEEEDECEDIGFHEIDITDIARSGKDIIEQELDLYDANTPKLIVGTIKLSLRASAALRSVYAALAEKKGRAKHTGTL